MTKKKQNINSSLLEKYNTAPSDPGVYLMKDKTGKIIYVGKALNLKKRLASYFAGELSRHDMKTGVLIKKITDFETIITSTEHEALILESNLIKKYKPRYNIILKDGKNYPCLRLNIAEKYPALEIVRKIKKDNALYFGPYSSAYGVRNTLRKVNRIFKLRKCRKNQFNNRSRPCLNFQIKACLGPCCNDVAEEEYKKIVKDVVLFLKGKAPELVRTLKQKMHDRALNEEFEEAAGIRDTIFAIEKTLERQVAVSTDMLDRDVIACEYLKEKAVVTILFVRAGNLIGTRYYHFNMELNTSQEILEAFIRQYYEKNAFLPCQILISENISSRELLEHDLSLKKKRKVKILVPVRGEKKRIVEMAANNGKKELKKLVSKETEAKENLETVKRLLHMPSMPVRIECFDNSNTSGTDPVSSMVVFINGFPDKSKYRKYILKNIKGRDDYACMTEVLTRRFSNHQPGKHRDRNHQPGKQQHVDPQDGKQQDREQQDKKHLSGKKRSEKLQQGLKKDKSDMEFPDLLLVDGGKGQISMAMAVLKQLGLENRFQVAGIAKKDTDKGEDQDKIYLPNRSNPVNFTNAQKALFMLQRLRDEAHRFAITFQRKRRSKRAEISILDKINGIGPKKKQLLFEKYRGISKMKKASIEELASLPGMTTKIAQNLAEELQRI